MQARLVRIEDEREVSVIPLGEDALVIGRDASADVVIDHPRISRHHVRVEPADDGYQLTDLGSSNGTSVNGKRIAGSVPLEPDDRIDLAGGASFVYELSGGLRPAVWIGALLVAALLGGGALYWLGPFGRDPVMAEAVRLAEVGLAAYENGEWYEARGRLTEAVTLLYDAAYLDDVPRHERKDAGLRRLAAQLARPVDLVAVFEKASEASRPAVVARPSTGTGCRLDQVPESELDRCIRERAEEVLVAVWQDPAKVPQSFHEAVRGQLRMLAERNRAFTEGALERGEPLFAMIDRELEAEHMPPMLRYLALIESGYRTDAGSPAGAVGLWQFMRPTAKQFGLAVDGGVDERKDPSKATRAAARYLNALAFEFGGDALLLAIAAYNKGENGVRRALKKLRNPRTERTYWHLAEHKLLPQETEDYVPRFVAAAILGEAGLPPRGMLAADAS